MQRPFGCAFRHLVQLFNYVAQMLADVLSILSKSVQLVIGSDLKAAAADSVDGRDYGDGYLERVHTESAV